MKENTITDTNFITYLEEYWYLLWWPLVTALCNDIYAKLVLFMDTILTTNQEETWISVSSLVVSGSLSTYAKLVPFIDTFLISYLEETQRSVSSLVVSGSLSTIC